VVAGRAGATSARPSAVAHVEPSGKMIAAEMPGILSAIRR
jgi:hypothetical protein